MRKLIVTVLVILSTVLFSFSQNKMNLEDLEKIKVAEDSLVVYAYGVLKDTIPERRFYSCKQLIVGLKNALQIRNSFDYKFPKLESVSIQYPADSSFRIFTWQLYVDKDDYRYYGAIQMKGEALQLTPLIDRSYEVADVEQSTLKANQWYGSVYYRIKEVGKGDQKYYLLFGFDGYEFFRKRKVLDVLSFENGVPSFGLPIFVRQETNGMERTKKRLLLEYSAEVSSRLNYDENLGIIIFDHLIEMQGKYGEGVVNFPDGSYEGYRLSDDMRWMHIDKVFNQVSDEPPRPNPILDGKNKKDLFGRSKGNQ